jgi:hypothetical protein
VNPPDANPQTASPAGLGLELSGANTGTIGQDVSAITIQVTDVSGRCPSDYQASQAPQWDGNNVFSTGL